MKKKLGRGRIIGGTKPISGIAPSDIPKRPSAFEIGATVMAPPPNAGLRERAEEVIETRKTMLATEHIREVIGVIKEETEIPFEGGKLRKIRQLSSHDTNLVGDVWLAEKTYDDGRERELVVVKRIRSEEELFGKKADELRPRDRIILDRFYQEAGEEIKNLQRFADNEHIVSPVADVYPYKGRLVVQMEFVPHTLTDYSWNVDGERQLSDMFFEIGIQILDTITYLENSKDGDAPDGRVNNDFKLGNLGVDKKLMEDGKTRIIAKMLDLDSIRPISKRVSMQKEMKYSLDCDPEQFMELHDANSAFNAKPDETIYSLGMAVMYALEKRMSASLSDRSILVIPDEYEEEFDRVSRPTLLPGEEKFDEVTTKVQVIDTENMLEKIDRARTTDELNLLKLYFTNKQRRVVLGLRDYDTPEMIKLVEKHREAIISKIMPEIYAEMKWCGHKDTLHEVEFITKEEIEGRFKGLLYTFAVDDKTAEKYGAKDLKERLALGIKFNIGVITEDYAKANYPWYMSSLSYSVGTRGWYFTVTELLQNVAKLGKEEAGELVELAKREEKGRRLESIVKPELFEVIAYCLKERKERLNAEEMKKLFEMKRKEAMGDVA